MKTILIKQYGFDVYDDEVKTIINDLLNCFSCGEEFLLTIDRSLFDEYDEYLLDLGNIYFDKACELFRYFNEHTDLIRDNQGNITFSAEIYRSKEYYLNITAKVRY